jgi:WD40 repeat protein
MVKKRRASRSPAKDNNVAQAIKTDPDMEPPIANDVMPLIARLALDGETFDKIVTLGQEVAQAIETDPDMERPWNHQLEIPTVLFSARSGAECHIVPTIFSRNGKHLLAEIRLPCDYEIYFGLVIWSRERASSYIMYSLAEWLGDENDILNTQVRVLAYAMPLDGQELVISDTYGGLVRMILNDDALYGTLDGIKERRNHLSQFMNFDCLLFTKDGKKLITGNVQGRIEIRDRHFGYTVLSQFEMDPHPYWPDLSCMAVGRNDKQLALNRYCGKIELWDIETMTKTSEIKVARKGELLSNLQYSPNSEHLLGLKKVNPNQYKIWHYHFQTGKTTYNHMDADKVDEDDIRINRAGFFDNLHSWTVTNSTLRDWNVADGTSVGKDHPCNTDADFALSNDRSTVAYLGRNCDRNISRNASDDESMDSIHSYQCRGPVIVDHFLD